MSRPDRPLFTEVSVTVATGDRLGVVGINGSGKSTLLRVLAGTVMPESGEVRRGRNLRVSVLDQDAPLPVATVLDAVVQTGCQQWEAEAALSRLGMGELFSASTTELSGGEQKRVALAAALVGPSSLLILDEPTNHLDGDGIRWLEDRLAGYPGALIVVTHDRHVLDRLATDILELDRGRSYVHTGGYAAYLEARSEREAAAESAEAVRRNLARRELAWLRRGAPARTSKPKHRIDAARELVEGRPEGPARPAGLHLEFPTPRLGDVVVELHDVEVTSPDGRRLFGPLELLLDRRERLAVGGPNGAGKSTLLDIVARRRPPAAGSVRHGSTVQLAYYTQTTEPELDPEARVREVLAGPHRVPDWTDARLLEAFWFDTDAQWAQVHTLSGGELRRLHLLTVLASKPNVLLLDEPTNDLDLETLRALEDFLEDWPGALVVVSHDRAFLDRVANRHLTISGGRVLRGRTDSDQVRAATGPRRRPGGDTRRREARRRSRSTLGHLLRRAELEMAELTDRKTGLEAELARLSATAGSDFVELARLGQEHAQVAADLDEIEMRWLELCEERDQLDTA